MPYELSFAKNVGMINRAHYINECCVGGDLVAATLLPALQARYDQVGTGQEDWGWFIWFTSNGLRLAVDIFTDDARIGSFRVRVATSTRGPLFARKEIDTAALEELRQVILESLTAWLHQPPLVVHID